MNEALVTRGTAESGAVFSPDGRYRYSLWRVWDQDKPAVLFVMLNPSTATHEASDPTVTRCRARAERWGMGGLFVGNVYAFRATDPKAMFNADADVDIAGPHTDEYLARMAAKAEWVVAAWGANAGKHRVRAVVRALEPQPLFCLGVTSKSAPTHPLYVPYAQELIVWSAGPAANLPRSTEGTYGQVQAPTLAHAE